MNVRKTYTLARSPRDPLGTVVNWFETNMFSQRQIALVTDIAETLGRPRRRWKPSRLAFAMPTTFLALVISCSTLYSQSPVPVYITGPGGSYNGKITTGGSYDPYTLNASRTVTDVVVNGSVTKIPLTFTRSLGSRFDTSIFGESKVAFLGSVWAINLEWQLEEVANTTGSTSPPSSWLLTAPSGDQYTFPSPNGQDNTWYFSSGGTGLQLTIDSTDGYPIVYLPDGSFIHFVLGINLNNMYFHVMRWTDPFGQSLTYRDTNVNNQYVRMVSEPGGRWIKYLIGESFDATQVSTSHASLK